MNILEDIYYHSSNNWVLLNPLKSELFVVLVNKEKGRQEFPCVYRLKSHYIFSISIIYRHKIIHLRNYALSS